MSTKKQFRRVKDKGDINNIKTEGSHLPNIPFLGIISGSTGSGKTSVLVSMLADDKQLGKYFKPRNIYIFSPLVNDFKMEGYISSRAVPDLNIFTELDPELLNSLYDTLAEQYSEEMVNFGKVEPKLILIDDFGYSGLMRKREGNVISRFFCNCRKHNISLFVVNQHYVQNVPVCRSNSNYLIVFNTNDKNLDKIAEEHGFLKSKKEFKEKMRKNLTEKHDFIIINYHNSRAEGLYLNKNFNVIA